MRSIGGLPATFTTRAAVFVVRAQARLGTAWGPRCKVAAISRLGNTPRAVGPRATRLGTAAQIDARWGPGSTGQYARKSQIECSAGIASVLPGATWRADHMVEEWENGGMDRWMDVSQSSSRPLIHSSPLPRSGRMCAERCATLSHTEPHWVNWGEIGGSAMAQLCATLSHSWQLSAGRPGRTWGAREEKTVLRRPAGAGRIRRPIPRAVTRRFLISRIRGPR